MLVNHLDDGLAEPLPFYGIRTLSSTGVVVREFEFTDYRIPLDRWEVESAKKSVAIACKAQTLGSPVKERFSRRLDFILWHVFSFGFVIKEQAHEFTLFATPPVY